MADKDARRGLTDVEWGGGNTEVPAEPRTTAYKMW